MLQPDSLLEFLYCVLESILVEKKLAADSRVRYRRTTIRQ